MLQNIFQGTITYYNLFILPYKKAPEHSFGGFN